jgi:hypothetical protein
MWDDKVAGLCARCQGRAKVFGLQVRVRGTQRWITIGRWGVLTPDQARQKARVLLGRLASGEDVVGRRQRFKTLPSVDELADEFIAQHVLPKLAPPQSMCGCWRAASNRLGPPWRLATRADAQAANARSGRGSAPCELTP